MILIMECLTCLPDKSQESLNLIQLAQQSKSVNLLLAQAAALKSDLIILAAYLVAIIAFKRKMLSPMAVWFLVSLVVFQTDIIDKMQSYQVHIAFLIMFSSAAACYHDLRQDRYFYICAIMVIFQGIMAIDAAMSIYETFLSIHYETIITAIHCAFISSAFWGERIGRHYRRVVNYLRIVKAHSYTFTGLW